MTLNQSALTFGFTSLNRVVGQCQGKNFDMSCSENEKYPVLKVGYLRINDIEVEMTNSTKLHLALIYDLSIFMLKQSFENKHSVSLMINVPEKHEMLLKGSLMSLSLTLVNLVNVEIQRLPVFNGIVSKSNRFHMEFHFNGSANEILYFQESIESICSPKRMMKSKYLFSDSEEIKLNDSFIQKIAKIKSKAKKSSPVETPYNAITIQDNEPYDESVPPTISNSKINIT